MRQFFAFPAKRSGLLGYNQPDVLVRASRLLEMRDLPTAETRSSARALWLRDINRNAAMLKYIAFAVVAGSMATLTPSSLSAAWWNGCGHRWGWRNQCCCPNPCQAVPVAPVPIQPTPSAEPAPPPPPAGGETVQSRSVEPQPAPIMVPAAPVYSPQRSGIPSSYYNQTRKLEMRRQHPGSVYRSF